MKQHAHRGHASKHAGTHKQAHAGKKHHPSKAHAHAGKAHHPKAHAVAKHPHHAKPRGAQRGTLEVLPPRSGAVAGPRQVPGASLHDWAACSAVALGASLSLWGHEVTDGDVAALHTAAGGSREHPVTILAALTMAREIGLAGWFADFAPVEFRRGDYYAGTVLGLQLPGGAHAVTVAPDGCWLSWGEHYYPEDFPGFVFEEAWAVAWL